MSWHFWKWIFCLFANWDCSWKWYQEAISGLEKQKQIFNIWPALSKTYTSHLACSVREYRDANNIQLCLFIDWTPFGFNFAIWMNSEELVLYLFQNLTTHCYEKHIFKTIHIGNCLACTASTRWQRLSMSTISCSGCNPLWLLIIFGQKCGQRR